MTATDRLPPHSSLSSLYPTLRSVCSTTSPMCQWGFHPMSFIPSSLLVSTSFSMFSFKNGKDCHKNRPAIHLEIPREWREGGREGMGWMGGSREKVVIFFLKRLTVTVWDPMSPGVVYWSERKSVCVCVCVRRLAVLNVGPFEVAWVRICQ